MHINVYRVHWHSFEVYIATHMWVCRLFTEVCIYIVWFVTVAYSHTCVYTMLEMGICVALCSSIIRFTYTYVLTPEDNKNWKKDVAREGLHTII